MAEKKVKPPVSVLEAAHRRKQNVLLFGGFIVLVAIAVTVAFLTDNTGAGRDAAKKAETRSLTMGPRDADKEAFRSQFQSEVDEMRKRLRTNEQEVRDLTERLNSAQRSNAGRPGSTGAPGASDLTSPPPGGFPVAPPPSNGQAPFSVNGKVGAVAPPPAPPSRFEIVTFGGSKSSLAGSPSVQGGGAFRASDEADPAARRRNAPERFGEDDPLLTNRAGGRGVDSYIPPAFMRAVMLNGVDAPTGGSAQNNTMPVLLEVIEDATLPNRFKAAVRQCFVLGDSYGDLSSERLLIRLTRMSCVSEDGGAIDVRVSGYINGPDGKVGVRGTLVTKTGQLMANTLLAGLISGFGQALALQGTQQNTTINGAVTSTVTNPWAVGFGAGVSKSFTSVADYWQRMADKIFPVVSVESGTVVDVVFSRGTTIETTGK